MLRVYSWIHNHIHHSINILMKHSYLVFKGESDLLGDAGRLLPGAVRDSVGLGVQETAARQAGCTSPPLLRLP